MITEDYVSYGTSKLLKEKGFDDTCRAFWKEWNGEINLCDCNSSHTFEYCHNTMLERYNDSEETNIAAPTLQMAVKWLWQEHKLHVEPTMTIEKLGFTFLNKWHCFVMCVDNKNQTNLKCIGEDFGSYEEACEFGIKHCLENLI